MNKDARFSCAACIGKITDMTTVGVTKIYEVKERYRFILECYQCNSEYSEHGTVSVFPLNVYVFTLKPYTHNGEFLKIPFLVFIQHL